MRNLFLKGLPREFWEDDLRALCAALDTTATSCLVWKDKKSKSRGVALVEVEDEQQAAALAQSLRRGVKLVCSPCRARGLTPNARVFAL